MENNPEQIKYFLYARKSSESEDRQVLSIDSQVGELQQIATRSSLQVLALKTEAQSAKAPGRPIFDEVLNQIEAGKAQGVIAWNADRLSRNSVDTGRLIYLFDIGKLHEVVTPTQVFRNTPNDKFLLNLLCSQAKLENDNKGINVKRGLKAKAERGIYPAPAPLGYMNEPFVDHGQRAIKPDPKRFPLVHKIFQLFLTGTCAVAGILRIANEKWKFKMPNGKPLSRSNLYRVLTHPFYAGIFEYPRGSGNWYRGAHKPMISIDEHDRIQVLLGSRGRPRHMAFTKKRVFQFAGMIRCGECGCMVTAEEKVKRQKNGNIHRYVYYHCTKKRDPNCTQASVEETNLKAQIMRLLDEIQIQTDVQEFASKWFRSKHGGQVAARNAIMTSQRAAFEECVGKINELIDMRAAREITQDEFLPKKTSLLKEKLRVEQLLADSSQQVDRWLETADEMFSFVLDAKKKFQTGPFETRRRILSTLGSNPLLKDKKLSIDLQNSLVPVKTLARVQGPISDRFEPPKIGSKKAQSDTFGVGLRPRLRALDDIRTALMQLAVRNPKHFALVREW